MIANKFRVLIVFSAILFISLNINIECHAYTVESSLTAENAVKNERDTQERSAQAAEVQAAQAAAQTPFVYAGAIAAILALALSTAALIHSVNTARRQQRAYILLDHVGLLHPAHDEDYKKRRPASSDQPILIVHLKNFGTTPATDVLHWAGFDVLPVGAENGVPLQPPSQKCRLDWSRRAAS